MAKFLYILKQHWLKILAVTLTVLWIIVLLFPLYWLLVSSTKDPMEANRTPPNLGVVLPKDYTLYLDTTDVDDYTEDDFIYESLLLQWKISARNLTINLNSITVARVENDRVIATSKLTYATYKREVEYAFPGSVTEEVLQNYKSGENVVWKQQYNMLLTIMENEGYETGLDKAPKSPMDSKNIQTINRYLAEVMDPNYSLDEKIHSVKGTLTGISYTDNFVGVFDNYVMAWENRTGKYPFIKYIGNSAFVAVMAVVLQFLFSACVAYGLSFLVKKHISQKILLFFIITIMLPGIVEQIPLYTTLMNMNLNNYIGILLPGATSATFVVLFKGFFDQLPHELREAAKLDGAGEFYIYFNVAIPLSMPVYATVGIMTFLGQWNTFFWPNLLLDGREALYTFPMIIQRAMQSNEGAVTNYPMSLAMSVIATIPTFFMFAFMQKQMRAGLVLGGVKG